MKYERPRKKDPTGSGSTSGVVDISGQVPKIDDVLEKIGEAVQKTHSLEKVADHSLDVVYKTIKTRDHTSGSCSCFSR